MNLCAILVVSLVRLSTVCHWLRQCGLSSANASEANSKLPCRRLQEQTQVLQAMGVHATAEEA